MELGRDLPGSQPHSPGSLTGLAELRRLTHGNEQVCIAVLDGRVDLDHPCFEGADLTELPTMVAAESKPHGPMAAHGTHVASVLFGQPDTPVEGITPACRGLIVPVFSDDGEVLSQLDLARAINQAVEAGANVLNVSGGQVSRSGEAEDLLAQAVRNCADRGVLIVAAAGNDGCACLHVPAALPAVLAVGAMDDAARPLPSSNWGDAYRLQGILAPGLGVVGAKPGGGTERRTGSSFATPIVSGVAGLLLSRRVELDEEPDPLAVRQALLDGAAPCESSNGQEPDRCLVGTLDITHTMKLLTGETMERETARPDSALPRDQTLPQDRALPRDPGVSPQNQVEASGCGCGGTQASDAGAEAEPAPPEGTAPPPQTPPKPPAPRGLVYAIGTLGYDFGNEARRDSFKQLMPPVNYDGVPVPANPHDARQMADHLANLLPDAAELIWTLNVELTPIYAFVPTGPFAREVYEVFQLLLNGLVQPEDSADYIQKVSIPGRLTGETVQLFSGQRVPLVAVSNTRGIYGWQVNKLVEAAMDAVRSDNESVDETAARMSLANFLDRVYYEMRNLGQTSQERALNFAATNAFQVAQTFSQAVGAGMELANINVMKSPFCRMDSDCWDVVLTFFDAENLMRARKTFRFTIDVSDLIPVTLGEVRAWSSM